MPSENGADNGPFALAQVLKRGEAEGFRNGWWEVVKVDLWSGRDRASGLEGVFKLADVARPLVAQQGVERAGCETVDVAVAAATTAAFSQRMRGLADAGVKEVHVFYAGPAALALLLGASINAGPTIVLYHQVERAYVETVRLHP